MDALERIADVALDATVTARYRPAGGAVADTWLLELAGEPARVACKLGGASVWTGDVVEPRVVRLVRETTDLPVPAVLASGSLAPAVDGLERWALYEFREGEPADARYRDLEPAARRRLVADAGAALGRLHAAHPRERVGGLARDGRSLAVRRPSGWHAPAGLEPRVRPALTHGDYHPGNLLATDDGRLGSILDWGNAHVANAEYALARAEARFVDVHRFPRAERARLHRTFREAYARCTPLAADFDERAPAHKRRWLLQSAINYARIARTPRGRTQLRRQLRGRPNRR